MDLFCWRTHFHEECDNETKKLVQKKKKMGEITWIKSELPKTDLPLFINQLYYNKIMNVLV